MPGEGALQRLPGQLLAGSVGGSLAGDLLCTGSGSVHKG